MLPSKRLFPADEELGKKDDDHRPQTRADQRWQPELWKLPRRRRLLLVPVILYLLFMFFKNMPTDIGPARDRSKSRFAPSQHIVPDTPLPPTTPQSDIPPDDWQDTGDNNNLYYEGKLRFSNLGKSLKPFRSHSAKSPFNATVFAAGGLGSVSDLLPLACRMANEKLNTIHFVLMGRDDISVEGIQQVNGLDDVNCPINWHGEHNCTL